MCVKSQNDMTVPTLHNGTNLKTHLQNVQLPHSSDVKTIGIQTMQTAIHSLPAHFPSSPMRRIDLLSWGATVLPANQRGQTIRATNRAKTGVNNSRETAFYAVSLAIGHRSFHPMAGCNRYLHSYLSKTNFSKKTKCWAVCHCMWAKKLILWFGA